MVINNSRSKASAFLLVAYLIFVILTAIVNYIPPFSTYLFIFLGIAGIILLLNLLPKSKGISAGKGKAKTAIGIIALILIIVALVFVAYSLAIFGSPDKVISAGGQSSLDLGNDSFGKIEIYFANLKIGEKIIIEIGSYQAGAEINYGFLNSGRLCWLGSWKYNGANAGNPLGEPWYLGDSSRETLSILNQFDFYRIIKIGDSSIRIIDGSFAEPLVGEKKVSCGSCELKEVRIFYNPTRRLKNAIGLE